MKLLDYHRLRHEEERSWDRVRLREDAGRDFVSAAGPLLPDHDEPWSREQFVRFSREPWFEGCLRLCALYRDATDAQRTWLRSSVDRRIAGKLGIFGLRAAILAAREHDPALARAGSIAFAIVDLTGNDIRDFLVGFTLLVHCAARAGADVPALLRDTASLAGPAIGTLYNEWADRYPDVAAIGSMGWREVETDAGPGFRNC